MFEQSLIDGHGKTNTTTTVALSFLIQAGLISVLVVLPMIFFEGLQPTQLASMLVAPPPPPPPPAQIIKVVKIIPKQFDAGRLVAPKTIPKDIAMIREEELPPAMSGGVGVIGGVPGGVAGGVISGIIGSVPTAAPPPPPPPPPPKAAPPSRIRVGGAVTAANISKMVRPTYPPLAKQARIQGTVRFNAIIAKDGTIQNLQVVSGHPLLIPSATEAVRQWIYKPTQLNGEPVEVQTQIDVNFTLSN